MNELIDFRVSFFHLHIVSEVRNQHARFRRQQHHTEATEDLSSQPVISLPPPLKLKLTGEIGMKFKQWESRWNNYVIATQLDKCSAQRRCAIVLPCIGEEALTIIDALDLEDDDCQDPDKILDKLKDYCVGTLNEIYERFIYSIRETKRYVRRLIRSSHH